MAEKTIVDTRKEEALIAFAEELQTFIGTAVDGRWMFMSPAVGTWERKEVPAVVSSASNEDDWEDVPWDAGDFLGRNEWHVWGGSGGGTKRGRKKIVSTTRRRVPAKPWLISEYNRYWRPTLFDQLERQILQALGL